MQFRLLYINLNKGKVNCMKDQTPNSSEARVLSESELSEVSGGALPIVAGIIEGDASMQSSFFKDFLRPGSDLGL
ncbi:MAG: hypothetical protein ACJAYF_003661 [Arenicella sp.]|jgi:hypothetical protein